MDLTVSHETINIFAGFLHQRWVIEQVGLENQVQVAVQVTTGTCT